MCSHGEVKNTRLWHGNKANVKLDIFHNHTTPLVGPPWKFPLVFPPCSWRSHRLIRYTFLGQTVQHGVGLKNVILNHILAIFTEHISGTYPCKRFLSPIGKERCQPIVGWLDYRCNRQAACSLKHIVPRLNDVACSPFKKNSLFKTLFIRILFLIFHFVL